MGRGWGTSGAALAGGSRIRPVRVTPVFFLSNEIELFSPFFNFMQLQGLDESLQRVAARSCFYWENEKYRLPNQSC